MSAISPAVDLSITGHLATLILNIPTRHNALDGDNIRQVCEHLATVAANPEVRVLIITGSGDKTFCAGAALDQLGSGAIDGDRFTDMTDRIAAMRIPTIAAFNGSAYGGGSEIGLACDFRIGIEGMRVFVPPARIGLCYPVRGIERFVNTLGLTTAKRLLVASEEFNAEQLLAIGYLTQLVSRAELPGAVDALAQRLAGYAPLAVQAMKAICQQVASIDYDRQSAIALAKACNNSEDLQEGLQAQKDKRPPVFQGK
jgi:enoyl-CoA hydratase/carnithine racemase